MTPPSASAARSTVLKRTSISAYEQRPTIERAMSRFASDAPLRAVVTAQDHRLQAYEVANDEAVRAQRTYKLWGNAALMLTTLATLLSATMLLPIEQLWPGAQQLRGVVSGLQSAANVLALIVVWRLTRIGAVGRWIQSRAVAEALRGAYFRAVMEAPGPAGSDGAGLWRDKLAFFDAAHLDYQRAYFTSAERRHRQGASMLAGPKALATGATVVGVAIGAAAFAASLGLFQSGFLQALNRALVDPIRWQLGLNTMAASLLAYASARAMLTQDERNAALYAVTGARLDGLRTAERRAQVEAAAAAGDGSAVLEYAAQAQAVLDADHQAWVLQRPSTDPVAAPPPRIQV